MITIAIDDHIPFIKGVLEPFANIIYVKGDRIDRNIARDADGLIIRTRTRCNAELLDNTRVKFIATATIGYDHIDGEYCNTKGIQWHHAPGCNSSSVNQYIASILATLNLKHGISLEGRKIGIVGAGNVGAKIEKLASIFGLIPLVNDPPRERIEGPAGFVTLDEILETADIITFHVPLILEGIDRTFHMASSDFFNRLKKKPVIINSARGEVIDTEAIKEAMIRRNISGIAADVWENEPVPDAQLLEMSLVATPHIAGYSVEGKANGTASCVRAAGEFFGFGLKSWYPPLLPPPESPELYLNTTGKSEEQLISEAILSCYDVMNDDAALRKDPSTFESLRNFYPVRREFGAFRLNIENPPSTIINKLKLLGFEL